MGVTYLLKVAMGALTFALPATVTFFDVVGYVAKVEGASMQPVFNPQGQRSMDYVLLNKWAARNYEFQRGDIVSLVSPSNPDQKIIKRIVGLEGDRIRPLSHDESVVSIPEGHCWVEGDHHRHSLDSNLFGPVPVALITAKASHIVWPPRRWQRLKGQKPRSLL
ncbi:mitochondrial inner membrane protease subunit 2-like [Liolophura sinensis]|uniref:mitochondrial inner membrane protease subunit 2-like n=1 Tax=Liolophura sinensis TaxID=3198878 RepID=UPI003158CEB6